MTRMLNEKKLKIMTRMAIYESHEGAEDLKISSYYKNDYSSLKTLISVIWMTFGYALVVGIGVTVYLDQILEKLTIDFAILFIAVLLLIYFLLLLIYIVGGSTFYKNKYSKSRQRIKKFNQSLTRLNRIYEKEKN